MCFICNKHSHYSNESGNSVMKPKSKVYTVRVAFSCVNAQAAVIDDWICVSWWKKGHETPSFSFSSSLFKGFPFSSFLSSFLPLLLMVRYEYYAKDTSRRYVPDLHNSSNKWMHFSSQKDCFHAEMPCLFFPRNTIQGKKVRKRRN